MDLVGCIYPFLTYIIWWIPWTIALQDEVTVISGSNILGGSGSIVSPDQYPRPGYTMDRTSYIAILENMATEGTVEVFVDVWNPHPSSWLNVRYSKYGGYLSRVSARYDEQTRPPRVLGGESCCIRLEFQTGCCGIASGYSGFNASYRFIHAPGKGRRARCGPHARLCNGECLHPHMYCPCAVYGQYRCDKTTCIPPQMICDGREDCRDATDEYLCPHVVAPSSVVPETTPLYALFWIFITVCGILLTVVCLLCLTCGLEKLLRQKLIDKPRPQSVNGDV